MPENYYDISTSFDTVNYGGLMRRHVYKVLLICSSYDAFALEEDGRIDAQINREYFDLNLSNPPSFNRVASGEEALGALEEDSSYDIIISMYNTGEVDVFTLMRTIKEKYPDIPTVLMTNYSKEVYKRIDSEDTSAIDYVFCWYGNADLLVAIIKIIEDKMNSDNDILGVGVQCILLVEDSVRYYSSYLPAIYKIILQQSSEFLKEALNEQQQIMRKRARPKILLATNYSDAVELYEKYKDNMLGVISDIGFVVGKNDPKEKEKLDAGIDLCRLIKKDNPLMPFIMQSSQESMREVASELGVGFIAKYSKNLLNELSDYIAREFAFGDFIFTDPQTGEEIGRAKDLSEMQKALMEIPDDVLLYHSSQNHLSKWMFARGLFPIAGTIKALNNNLFASAAELREFVVNLIRDYRTLLGQGVVAKFDAGTYSGYIRFARMGEGSLGGKARGLAFINKTLQDYKIYEKYENVRVIIPRTVVVTTQYFDEFIAMNGLHYIINSDLSDEEVLAEFVSSRLPEELLNDLAAFIKTTKKPLAIRSSSELEDSHYQPFAGIYSTYMVPSTTNKDQVLRLISKAIKSVYASVFFAASRQYIVASGSVLSEEKMAVVIQEICGSEDSGYYFPTISGVARSLNYYPIGGEQPEDGVAEIAVGLGKLVVEGGQTLRFSPKYPKNILQLSTVEMTLSETQREMYVLDLKPEEFKTSLDDAVNLKKFEINSAKHFRNLKYVTSRWDRNNNSISESTYEDGRMVVTFNNILKYDTFPLADILVDLLKMGEQAMNNPVEIEFAVNLDVPYESRRIFSFLQIRPIVNRENRMSLDWDSVDTDDAIIYAESAVGMGLIDNVRDVIYIKPQSFDSARTEIMAQEVSKLNDAMTDEGRGYVLVGPGRWGSSDPWLGVPVRWGDISEAKVIIECGLPDFRVDPSQGTHFFQNLVSLGVGYLTINPYMGDGKFDIAQLDKLPAVYESDYIRHVRFGKPLYVFVDGRNNKAIIKKEQ